MKRSRRLLCGLLSLLMAVSLCPAQLARAAGGSPALTGSIGLTIRFDLPQTPQAVAERDLTLTVSGGGKTVAVPLPGGAPAQNDFDASVAVSVRNTEGVELTNENRLGYYEAVVGGLPAGETYEVAVTGTGYVPYSAQLTLKGYSRHLVIGTGDGSFALGDVNGDGRVDQEDLADIDRRLGERGSRYDLNGDGQVDVTDLSYVNYLVDAAGEADVLETAAIVLPQVDTAELTLSGGSAADLFSGESAVTLAPTPGKDLSIPITFTDPVELSALTVTCPEGSGALLSGSVEVEGEDGGAETFPFDLTVPEGFYAIGPAAGEKTVTVDLGRRVAVKKITIKVTQVEGQTGAKPAFATITQIEFLKDIVPENPQSQLGHISGLTAKAGDKKVDLAWNAARNVTGYVVAYGASAGNLTQTVEVKNSRASISGLENFTEYFFQVTAVNGDWRGEPSQVINATPEPASVPGAPSNIRVESGDQVLRLSWGKAKDASFYQVFFREAGTDAFTRFGGNLSSTSAVLTGLTNGKTYEVAVKAGNSMGVGPYSATAQGTPEREIIEMPELPADGRIPNSEVSSVVLTNPNNVDRSRCPSFSAGQLIDGDAATYWIARVWWESSEITYTFSQPQDMNYMILVPYLGGGYKTAIKNYTITARDAQGNVLTSGSYRAPAMTAQNYLVLPFPAVKGVKSLSVSLAEWEGNGSRVSVSEAAFYRSDSLPEDIAALFANDSFTQLRGGVTEAQIAALESRLNEKSSFYLDITLLRDELALARGLLAGGDALGVVSSGFQSRSASLDSAFGQSASDLQPLGVSVAVPNAAQAGTTASTTVAVYAELPGDAPVYIVPTQFYGESGIWRGGAIALTQGRNYLSIPQIGSLTDERGGVLYLTYAGSNPGAIRLQIRGGDNVVPIPVLELSGWYDMPEDQQRSAISAYVEALEVHVTSLGSNNLTRNVRNATELSTPSVLLSLPADRVLAGLQGVGSSREAMAEALYQNVLAWEEELFVANKVQGIIASDAPLADYRYPMTTRQNIRYMRMFAGAFMYAAGNHVGIEYGSAAGLTRGRPSAQTGLGQANGLFGWGIAHEIGHNMDKLGRAEITNNIYALAIQAWDGGTMEQNTRLTNSNIWQGVYDKVSAGRPGAAGNVFVQLGMYWQLHLAYDGAEEPLAFYNAFFKKWKAGEYGSYSYDDRVALTASSVAQRDLSEFFTRWGMTLSDGAKAELAKWQKETRAIWYFNDSSRSYRLANGPAYTGDTTFQAEAAEDTVTLTISSTESDRILGYEIRRNGAAIAFTTGGTYTDSLGAANNLTYAYSVIPVDKLGNRGSETPEQAVRVAYDKAIDQSLYTSSRNTDTGIWTFTMNSGAVAVTGIKVTGENLAGEYTVRVKADPADAAWVTAKVGSLEGSSTVGYFTKPGADAGDSRIWTYDAAVIEIEGIPADAAVSLLDYPGDRVDFLQGATVGLLAEKYVYDGGEIPAGTLVVLGTYRGDPVFNTVEVEARYSTAGEAAEDAPFVERPMNGYALLLAELPEDGQVSDISDGIFLFVPDMEAEERLNSAGGVTQTYPLEIRALLYRTDNPYGNEDPDRAVNRRVTSETLWIDFPDEGSLPTVSLESEAQ